MPERALRPCTNPTCQRLCNGGRCDSCRKAKYAKQDENRGSAASRGYGAPWTRLRDIVLTHPYQAHDDWENCIQCEKGHGPLCRMCRAKGRLVAATEVDHEIPKAQGGTDELSNLNPLCKPHHSAKTLRESVPRHG